MGKINAIRKMFGCQGQLFEIKIKALAQIVQIQKLAEMQNNDWDDANQSCAKNIQ